MQLSSTKNTKYEFIKKLNPTEINLYSRKLTPLSEIVGTSLKPNYSEIDTVGLVVDVVLPQQPNGVTKVYLVDDLQNFISIVFWASLSVSN